MLARTRVVVIRHAREASKISGSGKLVSMVLKNAELISHGATPDAAPIDPSLWERAALLFPDPSLRHRGPPPKTLVVLDGTWAQARRMRQRIPALSGLPTWTAPPRAGAFVRARPTANHLPTALAVAEALRAFGDEDAASALTRALERLVQVCKAPGRRRHMETFA